MNMQPQHTNKIPRNNKALLLGALLATPLLLQAPAARAEIAQVPLFVDQSVDPNIMFTIDDSGSMQFEVMPATDISSDGKIDYMYPNTPDNTYDSSGYSDNAATFKDDPVNAYLRSSHNNKIYYNPEVTYAPWSKQDGTLWDDADIKAAYWNPGNTDAGTYNLLEQHTVQADWVSEDGNNDPIDVETDNHEETFWPMVYWIYKGTGSVYETSSYDKVEIRADSNGDPEIYINDLASNLSTLDDYVDIDLAGDTGRDTVAEEAQNFANWFQYYRSRALLAKAGIGRAFSQQGSSLRVGFATINELADGNGVKLGVRKFADVFTDKLPASTGTGDPAGDGDDDDTSDNYRSEFFTTLYELDIPKQGTPLRNAMEGVGEYFEDDSKDGPWSAVPGDPSNSSNNDAQLSCRQSFNVFMSDGYWNGGNPNVGNVDGSTGTTITGPNNKSYTYQPAAPFEDSYSNTLADVAMHFWMTDLRTDLKNRVPTSSADPAFWQHMVSFTVGLGVFGALTEDDLDELEAGTKTWPDPTNTEDLDRVDDLFHAGVNGHGDFFSASDPNEFAKALSDTLSDISSRVSSAASVATNTTRLNTGAKIYQALFDSSNWSGQLKAFNIISTGSDAGKVGDLEWNAASKLSVRGSTTRNIITLNTSATPSSVDFEWVNLNTDQTNALNQSDGLGEKRLAWIRGSHAEEAKNGGKLRNRTYVLGDIVNSDPTFVGQPDYRYFVLSGQEGLDYSTFRDSASYKARPPVIYIGANDGMLHAFNADTGDELFAYVPNALFDNLFKLTDPDYVGKKHQYFVDGSPRAGDAYFGNAWHTVLVGGLGAGGKAIYALDVTDPNNPKALWELTTANDADLGYTFAEPTLVRLADDKWYVLVANGYDSTNGHAELYLVDIANGDIEYTFTVDNTGNNGLSTPIPIDINADRITDYVYAGDLKGNIWKFDFTEKTPSKWGSAFGTNNAPLPLFTADSTNDVAQPITHRPDVGLHPQGGYMVYFGTGQYYETDDNEVPNNPTLQTFYGVRDVGGSSELTRDNLTEQTIEFEGTAGNFNVRVVSKNDVDYTTKKGWYLDLHYNDPDTAGNDAEGERVVSRPILRSGKIIFTTLIPSGDACQFGGTSWIMELDAINGGRTEDVVFDIDGDGDIDEDDMVLFEENDTVISGVQSEVGVVSTPAIISSGETETKYLSGSSGETAGVTEAGSTYNGRKSWRQLR